MIRFLRKAGKNMSKSLYSVVLTDEVVREVDRLALQQNTNRSNMINQILAQFVSYTTPEMRINDIFRTIEEFINSDGADIIPYVTPHQSTMSLKSSLEYRYRPTVKYEVELYRNTESSNVGRLSVIFRTQSQTLIEEMNGFFRLWSQTESILRPDKNTEYALYDGRFVRGINAENLTAQQTADAISDYIKIFDSCMKGYLSGRFSKGDVIEKMKKYLSREVLI